RFSAAKLYWPSGSEKPSNLAMTWPSPRAWRCTCALRRTDTAGAAAALRFRFFAGVCKKTSGVRQERRQLVFPQRFVEQAHPYRDIVEPARPKPLVEMPQAGREHAHHGHADVGPGLVEHEEVVAGPRGYLDTGLDLLAHAVERHVETERRRLDGSFRRQQERIVLDLERRQAVERRLVSAPAAAALDADRQELAE